MNVRIHTLRIIAMVLLLFTRTMTNAQTAAVWNGPVLTFSMAGFSDWTDPNNQDHLTGTVWLTRAIQKGMFNAASEGSFSPSTDGHDSSPADTEWALGSLSSYATLTYHDWETCYGGPGQVGNQIVGPDAVLHLITDNIYLHIKFTAWGGKSGGFTYERSTLAGPASAVTITNAIMVGTNFQFSFLSSSGFTNAIFSATNLVGTSWQPRTNVTGDGTLKTFNFPKKTIRSEFFRVSTQ